MTEPASFLAGPAGLPTLRGILAKLAGFGYSERGVSERLGLEDLAGLQWRRAPMHRSENLAARDPLALGIDLFLLQGTLPGTELERLFAGPECDALIGAGLLAIDDAGMARARASLFPVGGHLIFSDHAWPELLHSRYTTVPYNHVMAVGLDSRHLARCTARRPYRAALDLCTGSGIHALLASDHTERVLAVDINSRAALCTRFNAQVSGVANLEVVVGDLFEALRGERFDLITANPPFVPSPVDTVRFRDGGRSGEDVQKRIFAGLPRYLAPGGIVQIVTEFGERDGEPLADRLRVWLKGAPMDIHILRLSERAAAAYAIGHATGDGYPAFLDSVREWADNLRAQGYIRVVSVIVSLQWSDPVFGPPWERVDESPPPHRAAGAEIDDAFLAERLSRRLDLAQVLKRSRLCRAGPIALVDATLLGSDASPIAKATLLGQALTMEHRLDPVEREILRRADKPIPVAELIEIFGELKVEEPTVIAAARSLLRRRLVRIDAATCA